MTNLTVAEVYAIGLPIIYGMIALEAVFSALTNKSFYRLNDTLCTAGLLIGNILIGSAAKGLSFAIHIFLYQFRVIDLANLIPLWLMWVLAFVLIDLVFYIYHRLSHRVRFLWAIHMSHHSSEEMNFAVSLRQAWFAPLSKLPFFAVLPLLGMDPTIVVIAGVISTLWGVVGHTQIVDKLGPLELIFNTPSHHRVHHGANKEYIDKNYGNLFIIWDKMFGTFEPEQAPVKYGLVNNVNTFNPVKITFMGWGAILRDIRKAKSAKEALLLIFGPPNTRFRGGSF
tara:strand:+ start:595 stop:1443 length:849 start_codon:yes stop_codon:yes gene_type:complete